MALLVANQVTKNFGGLVAVNNLDFTLEQGAIVSVIGPNGAGKTTFFNCIAGFFQIDGGEIVFDGLPIQGERRGRLGRTGRFALRPDKIAQLGINRTYQNIRLFANMSALENLLVGQHYHVPGTWMGAMLKTGTIRTAEQEAHEEALRLLRFVGLQGRGDWLAKNLPYGDQRRLEIGRALATRPRLLLLDEPTAGMNPAETADMTGFIRRLRDELGITILLIEHEMRVVMDISERITVLDYGEKIFEGTPVECQRDRRVIEAYLGRGAAAELDEEGGPTTSPAPAES